MKQTAALLAIVVALSACTSTGGSALTKRDLVEPACSGGAAYFLVTALGLPGVALLGVTNFVCARVSA